MVERPPRKDNDHAPFNPFRIDPQVQVLGTLKIRFDDCKNLWEAFAEAHFTFDHLSFFRMFEAYLKDFFNGLHFLEALPNETRQQQANYFLTMLVEHVGSIKSFVQAGALTFEETMLSRALYSQIETRLCILAGPEHRQLWQGPNSGDNRPVIEEE